MDDMPLWVFHEVIDFGQFVNFYLFCSKRWGEAEMRQEHYALKSTKALRNACAHGDLVISGLSSAREKTGYQTNPLIAASLTAHGMKNTKSRRTKLSNARVEQMAAALYSLSTFCAWDEMLSHDGDALRAVRSSCAELAPLLPPDGSLTAYFDFTWKLVDIYLPGRV